MRAIGLAAASALVFMWSSAVAAQPFEPLDEEVRHNAAALEHAEAGRYDAAIEEQQQAVEIRGLNVFLLNLGRFQQRAGQCAAAAESFSRSMTAPPIVQPTADVVRTTAQKYLTQLAAECPATVHISCVPADMTVVMSRVGDAGPPTAVGCGQEVAMRGGTWKFVGSYGVESTEHTEDIRIAKSYEIRLTVETPVSAQAGTVPPPPIDVIARPAPRKSSPIASALLVTAGVGVMIGGLVADVGPQSAHNGELDGMDFVPLGFYIVGAALVVLGIVTW